tara:strand:+ start:444 stop:1160 length:717 start_codon:yes stop_codon:yes gene_type:complete
MTRKLSPRNTQIYELWQTGNHTYETIGKEFGVSRERIRQILKQAREKGYEVLETYEVSRNRSSNRINAIIENIDINEFVRLYETGCSNRQINDELNINNQAFKALEQRATDRGLTSLKLRIIRSIVFDIENPDELTKHRESIILDMKRKNFRLKEIAEKLSISKIRLTQIINRMKSRGIQIPNSRNTGNPLPFSELLDRVSLIESYLDDGKNVRQISLITNISEHSIKRLIYEHLRDV